MGDAGVCSAALNRLRCVMHASHLRQRILDSYPHVDPGGGIKLSITLLVSHSTRKSEHRWFMRSGTVLSKQPN